MNFPWNFLFVFFFSKQKSDFFFLCYREFWPLCSIFFSEPVVRLLCIHKLRPSKRPQSLEKLSDFPITLIHFIYNFWENLANFANWKNSPFWFHEFFFLFSLAEQSKTDSEITWISWTTTSARFCFSTPSFEVLFASCFSVADWRFSGNRQNLFGKPPDQLATFYAYLPTLLSFLKRAVVSFGMLRIWNYIGFFIGVYNIDLRNIKNMKTRV